MTPSHTVTNICCVVVFAQLIVDLFQRHLGRDTGLDGVFQKRLGDHHEHRRGHALAGYVRHHQRQVVVVDQEEVVKVAADLLGRAHGGKDVKLLPAREGREDARQHRRLNVLGHVQLRADALALGR